MLPGNATSPGFPGAGLASPSLLPTATMLPPPSTEPALAHGRMDLAFPVGDPNVTKILHWINQLTPEERDNLYNQLGVQHVDELIDILGLGAVDPDSTMHIATYEEQLMNYTAYRLHKIILLYVPPILIILGTFGNIFSFLILKRKAMLKFSTYFYLMVLALADTLVLYVGLLRLWIAELTGYELMAQADWICKLTCVVSYTVSDFSVWLIIAVTVERYVAPPGASPFVSGRTRAYPVS